MQGSAEVLADTLTKLSRRAREDPHHPRRRRRHQRVGRAARLGLERDHHRLQRAAGPQRRRRRRARERSTSGCTRSSTTSPTRSRRRWPACSSRRSRKCGSASAEVRQIFKTPKFGTVAGCMVTDGTIKRSGDAQARLLRDNVVVHEGRLGSLRRFKDDVSEVKAGFECGIGVRELQRHQGRRRHRSVHRRARRARRCNRATGVFSHLRCHPCRKGSRSPLHHARFPAGTRRRTDSRESSAS